ncbi:MAG: succinate dehydrogenase, hydrophobic membrane anchor protein [Gammaproteobacteria bacterium]
MSHRADGLRTWLLQRVSAIYLGVFLLYVLAHFWLNPYPDYAAWHSWIASPVVSIAGAGFILALLIHGWVGLRDVTLDYVHPLGLRLVVLTLVAFLLIGCGFWAMRILIVTSS